MKLIYSFEKGYADDTRSKAKLVDVRKLERSSYVKWINLLASNKTCKIEFINNNVRRKIIGEAWILDGRYDSTVKKNMLKNLSFYKGKGYDTVLVRFDCAEDKEKLV